MILFFFIGYFLADTKLVDNKHSGKFITNLTNDVGMITNLVSTAILNLFKNPISVQTWKSLDPLVRTMGILIFYGVQWKSLHSLLRTMEIPICVPAYN